MMVMLIGVLVNNVQLSLATILNTATGGLLRAIDAALMTLMQGLTRWQTLMNWRAEIVLLLSLSCLARLCRVGSATSFACSFTACSRALTTSVMEAPLPAFVTRTIGDASRGVVSRLYNRLTCARLGVTWRLGY